MGKEKNMADKQRFLISGKSKWNVVVEARSADEAKAKLYSELLSAEVRALRGAISSAFRAGERRLSEPAKPANDN